MGLPPLKKESEATVNDLLLNRLEAWETYSKCRDRQAALADYVRRLLLQLRRTPAE